MCATLRGAMGWFDDNHPEGEAHSYGGYMNPLRRRPQPAAAPAEEAAQEGSSILPVRAGGK